MSWTIDENYKIEMTKGDTKTVSFREEHTKSLEIGKYIWEMSLNKENGYRCTFIANKKLYLTVEVA